jgi:hypothetical protein
MECTPPHSTVWGMLFNLILHVPIGQTSVQVQLPSKRPFFSANELCLDTHDILYWTRTYSGLCLTENV